MKRYNSRLYLWAFLLAFTLATHVSLAQSSVDLNISLDLAAPVVSSISAAVTQSTATVAWLTNVPADSFIEYGTTSSYGSSTTLDPALVLSHSQLITGLSGSTTYHFRITSVDSLGFFQPTGDNTFTTSTVTQPPPSGGGSPGGGGGGSGGGGGGGTTPKTSSVPLDSITVTVITQPYVLVKAAVLSSFPIISLGIRSPYALSTVITVTNLESPNVPAPAAHVYKYLRLDGNTTDLDYIEIQFGVNRTWLDLYGFGVGDVKMVRYSAGAWQRLETYYTTSGLVEENFRSVTPGFSVFAIIAEKEAPAPPQIEAAPDNRTDLKPLISPVSQYPVNIQYFIISGAMFIVAVLLIFLKRRRDRNAESQEPPPAVASA